MKQCEKWLNRDGIDTLRPELRHWKGVCSEDGFKKGWRAALEWLRDNREMKAWDDVDDMIEKELKE